MKLLSQTKRICKVLTRKAFISHFVLACASIVFVYLLADKADGAQSASPRVAIVASQSRSSLSDWISVKVTRMNENITGTYSALWDNYEVTAVDPKTFKRYELYDYVYGGQLPLPLGLFIVGDTIQVEVKGRYICSVNFQGFQANNTDTNACY